MIVGKLAQVKLIRVPQLSRMLDVPEWRAYEIIRLGILPPGVVVRLGRQIRLNEQRLREWMDTGGQGHSSVTTDSATTERVGRSTEHHQ